MRKILKKLATPLLQRWFKKYYSIPRIFEYQGIKITVLPEIFPPKYTVSTKILLKYINTLDLNGKSFLELGCGSGIISLLASKKGATVTATDINEIALKQLQVSSLENNLELSIVNSDLFDAIPEMDFDYIIINPPYYPRNPRNIAEQAWYCGEDFEYFQKLFEQLPTYLNSGVTAIMILSEDCEIDKIQAIAKSFSLNFNCFKIQKSFFEISYLFQIKRL